MKSFVAILALVAIAAADVSHIVRPSEADSVILRQQSDVEPDRFEYGYETSNGIEAQSSGVLKNAGREDEAFISEGSVSYSAPDGQRISLTFTADENGYHPKGDHLPTPPPTQPIPESIQRALAFIAANPAPVEKRL